jgi:hypothetical protein
LAICGIVSEVMNKVQGGHKKLKSKVSMWKWTWTCDKSFVYWHILNLSCGCEGEAFWIRAPLHLKATAVIFGCDHMREDNNLPKINRPFCL